MGDGGVQAYHNEAMTQEAVYQTAGGDAETMTGGVNMNLSRRTAATSSRGGFKAAKSPAVVAGRQPHRRPQGAGRHRRRQDRQLLRVERRTGRSHHQGQALVLRRVPQGAVRQADRQHVRDAGQRAVPGGLRGLRAAARSAASRASRTRRWTTRFSVSPGRCRPQQVRRLQRPRHAPARPRDGVADRPDDGVGQVEHADLRAPVRPSGRRR